MLTVLDVRDDVDPVLDVHPQLVQLPPQVLQLVDIRLSQALPACTQEGITFTSTLHPLHVPHRADLQPAACCPTTGLGNAFAIAATASRQTSAPVVADVADVLIDDCFVGTAAGAQRTNKVVHQRCDGANVICEERCKGLLVVVLSVLACSSAGSAKPRTQQARRTSWSC
jgi:hypothetical protein